MSCKNLFFHEDFQQLKFNGLGKYLEMFNILDHTIFTGNILLTGQLIVTHKSPCVEIKLTNTINDEFKKQIEHVAAVSFDYDDFCKNSYHIIQNNKIICIIDIDKNGFFINHSRMIDILVENVEVENIINMGNFETLLKQYNSDVQKAFKTMLVD